MRQCRQCFEFKPTTGPQRAFSPRQARCLKCRAEHRRRKRLERTGKPVPLPSRYLAPYNAIKKLFHSVDHGTAPLPLEVPVRVRGREVAAPRACVIRLVGGIAWLYIASQRGALQLQYASTAPEALIYALEGLGLELILPGEAILASDHKGLA